QTTSLSSYVKALHRTRKPLYLKRYRGFESLPLRSDSYSSLPFPLSGFPTLSVGGPWGSAPLTTPQRAEKGGQKRTAEGRDCDSGTLRWGGCRPVGGGD